MYRNANQVRKGRCLFPLLLRCQTPSSLLRLAAGPTSVLIIVTALLTAGEVVGEVEDDSEIEMTMRSATYNQLYRFKGT